MYELVPLLKVTLVYPLSLPWALFIIIYQLYSQQAAGALRYCKFNIREKSLTRVECATSSQCNVSRRNIHLVGCLKAGRDGMPGAQPSPCHPALGRQLDIPESSITFSRKPHLHPVREPHLSHWSFPVFFILMMTTLYIYY